MSRLQVLPDSPQEITFFDRFSSIPVSWKNTEGHGYLKSQKQNSFFILETNNVGMIRFSKYILSKLKLVETDRVLR